MITFRKRAPESTGRPNFFLARPACAWRIAALLILLLTAQAHAAEEPRAQQKDEAASGEEAPAEVKIPVHVRRFDTSDGFGVTATIGDFPSDLNEAGREFLKREFFEHFASDVLGLGESSAARATLKIAMLPQEKDNQREGDFTFGKFTGHMVVMVEKRRVLVACTFSEVEEAPRMLASAGRYDEGNRKVIVSGNARQRFPLDSFTSKGL